MEFGVNVKTVVGIVCQRRDFIFFVQYIFVFDFLEFDIFNFFNLYCNIIFIIIIYSLILKYFFWFILLIIFIDSILWCGYII